MKAHDFNQLSLGEKQEVINLVGIHKALAAKDGFNYLLYSVHHFFVETSYNPELNEIHYIQAFGEDDVDWDKYIDTENFLIQTANK